MSDPIIIILILAIAGAVAAIVWGDAKIRRAGQVGLIAALVGMVWRLLGRRPQKTKAGSDATAPAPAHTVETRALDHMSSKTDTEVEAIEEEIDAIEKDEREDGSLHRPRDIAGDSRFAEHLRRLHKE